MMRGRTLGVFLFAGLFTTIANQVSAQSPASLSPGSRVRLLASGMSPRPLIGTILRGDETTVEIQGAEQKDPVVVRRDAITRLEVSLGRRSRGRGAGIGALVGFGIGVIPALMPEHKEECGPNAGLFCGLVIITRTQVGLVFGGIGAGVGALIGAAVPPGEKWKAVSSGLRVSVGGARTRDLGVSWSFEF